MAQTIGSTTLLMQLTTNLLQNAVVHNLPRSGQVWVTTAEQPTWAVLVVENTGPPLTAETVATLIEPFRRGSGRVHDDSAGAGLGLTIAEGITAAHRGTLAAPEFRPLTRTVDVWSRDHWPIVDSVYGSAAAQDGHSIEHEGVVMGWSCLALPVTSRDGSTTAVLGVVARTPTFRSNRFLSLARQTAKALERDAGLDPLTNRSP